MLKNIFCFILAVCVLFWLPSIPTLTELVFLLVLLAIGIILTYYLAKYPRTQWYAKISACSVMLLLGLCWALWAVHWQASRFLPNSYYNRSISVMGTIRGLPQANKDFTRFQFVADKFCQQQHCFNHHGQLLLSWYGPSPQLKPGQRWHLFIKLKQIRGYANPGGFDREKWLWSKGIVGTGYVKHAKRLAIKSHGQWLNRLRYKLSQQLIHLMGDSKNQGIILALTLGERSNIDSNTWKTFRLTGTSHLMAISGLHISIVAGLAFLLGQWLGRCFPRLLCYVPARTMAAGLAILAATVYAALAGFSISTQRALIMVIVAMLAIILKRQVDPLRLWLYALFMVVVWDPLAVLSAGFWLSFTAVFVILYAVAYRFKPATKLLAIWRVQWAVFIGLLPLSLWYFHQFSLVSMLANLLAIPWASFTIVPVSLLAIVLLPFPSISHALLKLALWSLQLLLVYLHTLQAWCLVWSVNLVGLSVMLCLMVGCLLILAPRRFPGRALAWCWWLPLLLASPKHPSAGEVWFTVLDVGQGLATVLQTQHHVLVYDTGPRFSHAFNAGDAVVNPFLHQLGIQHIDRMVISHGDLDHVGGYQAIKQQFSIGQLFTSDEKLLAKDPKAQQCQAGQHWQWGQLKFNMLYPISHKQTSSNNHSCVLQVQLGNTRILLPGDIERVAERELLQAYGARLKSSILIAPHHGSKTSSSSAFARAVHPHYVVYPVGWHNRYGFPHESIAVKYQQIGAKAYETAREGAISFIIKQNLPIEVRLYRLLHQHFWNELNQ